MKIVVDYRHFEPNTSDLLMASETIVWSQAFAAMFTALAQDGIGEGDEDVANRALLGANECVHQLRRLKRLALETA